MILRLLAANPEFQRQWWLEVSTARLLGMPAVLALVFAAVGLADPASLPMAARAGLLLLAGLYGARLAGAALLDEISEATWDAQRLSSLSPWQLAWGKLLGGTLFAWYGGAICLAVWLLSELALGRLPSPALVVGLLAVCVLLQASSLIAALAALRRGGSPSRRGGAWWFVLLFVFAPWFGALSQLPTSGEVLWWGVAFPSLPFYAGLAVACAAWAVLGAQRLMAGALQVPLRPLAWIGFQIWLAVLAAGFWPQGGALWRTALALAVVATSAAYASLLIEPPRLDLWQRFAARWQTRGLGERSAQERLPLLLASLALALVSGLVAGVLAPSDLPAGLGPLLAIVAMPLTWALVAARDLALACAIHWSPTARRAESTTLVMLVVMNLALPWLLHAAGLHTLAGWLQPLGGPAPSAWTGALVAALQAAGAVLVARGRWRPTGSG